ncbi:hypothetical protein CKO11_16550 [Rhodobacter sp. TJ_12]|uniref:hypothetical protein n=1 Tax=Rhodobacter sp. TJ_12 TaxID=2029399 RepID=UPI001CBD3030|nr:hypothetical protein [Rhodobacter sp. TJ_12]MBZ4024061.1 hypothetical protein [Rhodobacter sp. TJ_12]
MFKTLPPPVVSMAFALGLSAFVALGADAAQTGPETMTNMPWALAGFLRGTAVFFLAPAAVAAVLWHRALIRHGHALMLRLSIRLPALRPQRAPAPEAAPLAPAKHLAAGGSIDHAVKLRMTEVHRQLRALAPELLPVFADCRAAQARLAAEIRRGGATGVETGAEAEQLLIGGLVQIETATRKLSLVLSTTTKEHALGNFADTLEKLTSETLDCLVTLRARAKGAPQGMQIGGAAQNA